jgi:two-component system response regulator DesR
VIRVLLGHRGTLVRGALAAVLSREPDLDVVADFGVADEVLPMVTKYEPDLVVLDPLLPGGVDVFELCGLCSGLSDAGILILMDRDMPAAVSRAVIRLVPSVGLIATDASPDDLVEAVRQVHRGKPVLDVGLAVAALRADENPLTEREREVLLQVTTGATAQEVARTLSLSVGTVRNYLSRTLTKTGARSRIEAIRIAQDAGWI